MNERERGTRLFLMETPPPQVGGWVEIAGPFDAHNFLPEEKFSDVGGWSAGAGQGPKQPPSSPPGVIMQ